MRRPSPPVIESVHLPAMVGGLNTIDAASAMPPGDCVLLYNMVPAEYGLRARLGSREWVTGLTGATDNLVRSIIPFTGSAKSGAQDRLFAMTSSGIWDVSSSTAAPSPALAFSDTSGDAGYGVAHVVVTAAGHFLLYCDEVNGLHIYTQGSGTWAAVAMGGGGTEISGVNPSSFVHVTVFKNRVWFTTRDTARAWYLAAGAVYGAATAFDMGTKFRAGGPLVGLFNWTMDGGAGIDDSLVAISQGGDVVVWQGTDPASATTFGQKGTWYVGALPAGRNIASNFGGDMLILTRMGAIPMSRLLSGSELERSQYLTYKVGNLLNAAMLSAASLRGWSIRLHPEDGTLLVTVPTSDGQPTEQLAMSVTNKGWGRYRNLPIYSSEVWGGKLYYGTVDGKVGIHDGYVDGITLADPSAYTPVQWAILSSFQNLGNARQKQVKRLRPTFISEDTQPSFEIQAKHGFDFTELNPVSPTTQAGDVWNTAIWDTAVWGGSYSPSQVVRGAFGMGVNVAIACRGTSVCRTVFVGVDVGYVQGGLR